MQSYQTLTLKKRDNSSLSLVLYHFLSIYSNQPRQGVVFFNCDVSLENSWFGNYTSTDDYSSGALGFQRNNIRTTAHGVFTKNLLYGFNDVSDTSLNLDHVQNQV